MSRRARLVLVTGLSGAGKTTALKALEDMGYEVVDNLPIGLVGNLVPQAPAPGTALAIGVDVRTRDFAIEALLGELAALAARSALDVTVLFLDCDDDVLRQRFTETRRRHPLADDRPVSDGIRHERGVMAPLCARADLILDTSDINQAGLRRILVGHFALDAGRALRVFVTSFAFRHGLPREADLVFDVRFLRNPHYIEELRALSGLDRAVADYVERDPGFADFFDRLCAMLLPLLPRYHGEGKSYLTIAVGCTGGRHRSVVVAERLAARLAATRLSVQLTHRDVDRRPTGD
jgi:UPF0042 nucleotide-binding protein